MLYYFLWRNLIYSFSLLCRDILSVRQGSLQVSQPMFNLKEGDIVLELNGEPGLGLGEEEWQERRRSIVGTTTASQHHHHHQPPWRIVVGRRPPVPAAEENMTKNGGGGREEGGELAGLQEDIALIQSRLEEKLREGRDMGSILHLVQREKEGLERENTRLNHRIFYLEEQVYCTYTYLLCLFSMSFTVSDGCHLWKLRTSDVSHIIFGKDILQKNLRWR